MSPSQRLHSQSLVGCPMRQPSQSQLQDATQVLREPIAQSQEKDAIAIDLQDDLVEKLDDEDELDMNRWPLVLTHDCQTCNGDEVDDAQGKDRAARDDEDPPETIAHPLPPLHTTNVANCPQEDGG